MVIIDYGSRSMVGEATSVFPIFNWISSVFEIIWLPTLMALLAVLTDHGSIFISIEFNNYCLQHLSATLMHTSPY